MVEQNIKYVKLDDGVSFSLVRTNPKLTTNTKLMYNGKKMYMESYASGELLNRAMYKNVSLKQNSTYNEDIAYFLRGTGKQAYNVYQNFSDVTISDSYDNQFETLYWCGAEYIDSSFYDEEIGFVAPLYLREKLPNYFLIFRLDTPSNYNFNVDNKGNILDSTFNFKSDILDKAVLIKTFDLREGSVLGKYIRNYINQESFEFDKSMYVNFSNAEVTYYGINRTNGVLEKRVENFENELLKNDNPILKNDKWFTEGFERNGLIFPYIMNIEYLFDDDLFQHNDVEAYDFARYIGLYCNNIEFGEFSNFDELNVTEDNVIYYFEDNKSNLHRYVKKSNNDSEITIDGKSGNLFDENLLSGFEKERITGYAEPLDINEGYVNRSQYGFEILKPFEPGDWIGIEYEGDFECYVADDKDIAGGKTIYMEIGEYRDFRFSVNKNSTLNDIAKSLVKSVNSNKKSKFEAICFNNYVVFYAKREGHEFNGSEFGGTKILIESSLLYSKKISLPFSNNIKHGCVSNELDNNIKSLLGDYYIDYFCGYCDVDIDADTETYKNIFKIYSDESVFFGVDRYLKTNNGYGRKITSNIIYINEEGSVVPEYRIITVDNVQNINESGYDISVSSTYQVEILDKFKPNHGVISFFPVKDFDFDMNYTTYGQYGAFVDECEKLSKKITYNKKDTNFEVDNQISQKQINVGVNELAKSPFIDSYGDSLETEYDYYLENFHPELCLVSKTTPYISKWGYYDEQKDSCENSYRLNVSKVFGVSNLSSNTYLRSCDEKEYTHSMPYYMTLNNISIDYYKKNYQYIASDKNYIDYNDINMNDKSFYDCVKYWINEFKRTDEDRFSYYFSGKKYGKRFDRKYSRLMNGDKFNNPSTLFRGVKFEVVRQLNGVDKRSSEYNNYKFSFIYIPVMVYNITFDNTVHFVKNDTFKFIVGIVFVNTMLGVYNHNIFNGRVDYFCKGFLYSACKDIIRSENTNTKYTLNMEFVYSEDDVNYGRKQSFKNVNIPIIENVYDMGNSINVFYMWREIENDGKTVFITNTYDLKNKSDIICWLDEIGIDFDTNNNNISVIKDCEELGYEYELDVDYIDDKNEDGFKILWSRYYEEYDITNYGYKTFKPCGYISCDLNVPDISYENIIFSDVFDISDVYDEDEELIVLDVSKIYLKEGSLRNILINIGEDSVLCLHIYNDDEYLKIDKMYMDSKRYYNKNANYDGAEYRCDIKFDVENCNIIISGIEENSMKLPVYDIEKLKMDIVIRDKFDSNHNSLGLKEYFSIFEQISMYNITESINNNYNVKYYSTVEDNKYKIRVIEPDCIEIEDRYEVYPVTISQNNKNIVGSVEIKEKMDVDKIGKKVINRYSGFYNPIFTDILYYDDYNGLSYSNTNIDFEYNDGYGEFGIIKNLYYHKTNISRSNKILTSKNPVYPAINEYALDYRDYNIFSSSWDYGYFITQDDLYTSSICEGIGSMKDGLCMFGSKYLNLSDYIFIDTFENVELWDGKMTIDSRDNIDTEIMYKEFNDKEIRYYLFIKKRLKRYLKEKLIEVFSKYINKNYSYGNKGTVDDDVDEYIEKNLLKLYKVDKVYMYIKSDKVGKNDRLIENEYSKYLDKNNNIKIELGFPYTVVGGEYVLENGKFRMEKINEFDRYIQYTLKKGFKESFGFGILIKRI